MLENACYSVISPEGCASILWRDSSKVKEAAQCLKMTADDLLRLDVVERVIPEPADFSEVYETLKTELYHSLVLKKAEEIPALLQKRYDRFRKFGAT
jgi:acetyl-CoA carboxylase carboxyl transferase subunit alpha